MGPTWGQLGAEHILQPHTRHIILIAKFTDIILTGITNVKINYGPL